MKIKNLFAPSILCIFCMAFFTNTHLLAANQSIKNNKILVAFFSMPETTDPINMTRDEDNSTVVIDNKVFGNTEYIAYVIQEATNADIFRIEPDPAYPINHRAIINIAKEEKKSNARPKIKNKIQNLEQYDIIFIGYPNWNGDLPMILYSFLEDYNFAGKKIIPFVTHGGSGFSGTINTITQLQTNAIIEKNALSMSRNIIQESKEDIKTWIKSLNL